jgi:ATP-binding protein involved in chromosome partitioning
VAAPLSIEGLGKPAITVTWPDGHRGTYPAKYLRSRCRCAECIEEMTGRKLLDDATIPDDLVYQHIELVGGYAIAVTWSDGHRTGIYSFRNLRSWCPCPECQSKTTPASG